jgi:ABC-2 type transport system permease protein
MARLFVQLKLRQLRNALIGSTAARVSFIVSTIFAVLFAIGTFIVLALFRGTYSVELTSVVFTSIAFGWLFAPIFAFGLDSTLDPASMALYPVRTRPLATGLLAASATGAWPLANVLGQLGVIVGLAHGPVGVLVAVVAVVLQVLFCITLARFVTTGMAGLLRSRRGKDLAAFLFLPVFAAYELFAQVVPKLASSGKLTEASFAGFDSWMRWLPPGLAAHAIQDASDGHAGTAVARLAALAAVVVVLGWLWVRMLSRALVTADTSTQSSRAHSRGRARTALPLSRFGLRGALAARTWIYQRRDPTSMIFWGISAIIMVVVSIRLILSKNATPSAMELNLVIGGLLGAAFAGIFHANTVGMTGPPFAFESLALTGRRRLRAYFSGQNIALGAIGIPLLVAISFGLAALAGHPMFGFPAAAADLAGLGASLGLASVFSVALPYPMERRMGTPMLVAAQGYGGYRLAGILGGLIGTGVLCSPLVVAVALTNADPAAVRMPVLLVCAAAYGLALTWAGARIAAIVAVAKLPELCQVAIASKA